MENILIFDIETISNEKFFDFLPMPPLKKLPSNYTNPNTIDAFNGKALVDQKKEFNNQIEKMPLDVDFARICCLGIAGNLDPNYIISYVCHNEDEEAEALRKFWERALGATLIGYNIIHFDLPIIIRRSLILGVRPSFYIDQNKMKYNDYIIDLMLRLYSGGYVTNMNSKRPFARKQDVICKILGIENSMSGVDGSQVSKMTDDELIAYNENDIYLLQRLTERTQGYYW